MLVGERCALEAAAPEGIGLTPIKYTVSDPAILFPEEDGKWSALSAGTVQVTAETYNGLEASCEVQVLETARASFIENFEGLVQYLSLIHI